MAVAVETVIGAVDQSNCVFQKFTIFYIIVMTGDLFPFIVFEGKECSYVINSIPVSVVVAESSIFLLFTVDKEPGNTVYFMIAIVGGTTRTVIVDIIIFMIRIMDDQPSICVSAVVSIVLSIKIIVGVVEF